MIEVLAKSEKQLVIAVDYCIYLINTNKEVVPLEYLLTTVKFTDRFKYGNFTSEYSKKELNKYVEKARKYNRKYKELLVKDGELPKEDYESYVKKKYEQTLASFNSAVNKLIYSNVKFDPNWTDYYNGALREI